MVPGICENCYIKKRPSEWVDCAYVVSNFFFFFVMVRNNDLCGSVVFDMKLISYGDHELKPLFNNFSTIFLEFLSF